jgi:hypothetical protein
MYQFEGLEGLLIIIFIIGVLIWSSRPPGTMWCKLCKREVPKKRKLDIITIAAIMFTGGLWWLVFLFYPKKCTFCGHETISMRKAKKLGLLQGGQ